MSRLLIHTGGNSGWLGILLSKAFALLASLKLHQQIYILSINVTFESKEGDEIFGRKSKKSLLGNIRSVFNWLI